MATDFCSSDAMREQVPACHECVCLCVFTGLQGPVNEREREITHPGNDLLLLRP